MTVLPSTASFASFFVVFFLLLLFTALLGLGFPRLLTVLRQVLRQRKESEADTPNNGAWRKMKASATWLGSIPYICWYLNVLRPSVELDTFLKVPEYWEQPNLAGAMLRILAPIPWFLGRYVPVLLIHNCLIPEIVYPEYQLWLF
jgi:hypothetical protein